MKAPDDFVHNDYLVTWEGWTDLHPSLKGDWIARRGDGFVDIYMPALVDDIDLKHYGSIHHAMAAQKELAKIKLIELLKRAEGDTE